jgi:hypothetical protein
MYPLAVTFVPEAEVKPSDAILPVPEIERLVDDTLPKVPFPLA